MKRLQEISTRAGRLALLTGAGVIALPYALGAHGHHPWDVVPGFWAAFGGLGCAAIVVISKWLGHRFIQKPEDWYER